MPAEQLPLPAAPDLDPRPDRLPARIALMQPSDAAAPFDDPDYLFEPWWPGTRALAFTERGRVRLQVAGLADAEAAFPEMGELPAQLSEDGVVVEGTLLVLDEAGRPDPDLLRARLEGRQPRPGRAAYVAADLLWAGGESVLRRSFSVRREWLTAILQPGDRITVGHGYRGDGTLVAEALTRLGIDGLSARRLSARYRSGPAREAWWRAPLTPAPIPDRPTLALILRLPLDLPHPESAQS